MVGKIKTLTLIQQKEPNKQNGIKSEVFLSAADPPLKVIANDPEAHILFPNFHTTFTSRAFY